MLPFGGHRHGSSWINEHFRAGLSESLCIMSLCVPWQDDMNKTWAKKPQTTTRTREGIFWRHWQMSGAAGRQLPAPRAYACVGECVVHGMIHERQTVAGTLLLLWVALIRLQWCLWRTLRFWEIVAFPSCSHHHNLPLSSPPPGRKKQHTHM